MMRRTLHAALVIGSVTCFIASTANATNVTLTAQTPSSATILVDNGLEVVLDGADDLTFNIAIVSTIDLTGVGLSATFPGLTASGALPSGFGGNLVNQSDFSLLGPLSNPANFSPGTDSLKGWSWASLSGTVTPGTLDAGTITLTVDQPDTVLTFGTLTVDDGFLDSNNMFVTVPPVTLHVRIVPEPGSAALMVAAVGTVGFISRRARTA